MLEICVGDVFDLTKAQPGKMNFVAHFALTGHLFGVLSAASAARVVTMSSVGHRGAVVDFDNFRLE